MCLKPSCSFTDLLKLSRLYVSALAFSSRSIFERNEVDLGQFQTVVVFQCDTGHRSVAFTFDDDNTSIRPEPDLEGIAGPVWRRTDFTKTELLQECERLPDRLNEFPQRWGLNLFLHRPGPLVMS